MENRSEDAEAVLTEIVFSPGVDNRGSLYVVLSS